MHADSAYVIGASHETCQDYARTVVKGDEALAVVSDGCSSSPDTDIGARLCVLARLEGLGWFRRAYERCVSLGLRTTALDATLVEAVATSDTVTIRVYGDGYGVMRQRNTSELSLHTVQYPDGFPAYPNYEVDTLRGQAFLARSEGRFVMVQHWDPVQAYWTQVFCTEEPNISLGLPYLAQALSANIDLALVLTDGFGSFRRQGPTGSESVPVTEVIDKLCSFKLYKGLFVKRRLKRFLKDAKALGWTHDDDLGIAAIYLGN